MVAIFVKMISTRDIFPFLKPLINERIFKMEAKILPWTYEYTIHRLGYSAALKMMLTWVKSDTEKEEIQLIDDLIHLLNTNRF